MNHAQILAYYSREEVQDVMLESSRGREFVGSTRDGAYLKRPFSIQYGSDIVQMVKRGAVAFHMSVERWDNPSYIGKGAKRVGWDLVIDIDAKFDLEDAKDTAILILDFLKSYGIRHFGIKFSGRRGFHIIVPFEALPKEVNYRRVEDLYPELQRIVVSFIRRNIYEDLAKRIVKRGGIRRLMEYLGEIGGSIDPFKMVGVDDEEMKRAAEEVYSKIADAEKEWGERHLFRAPYSLNPKTWLVSMPISEGELEEFKPDMAKPDKVRIRRFIPEVEEGEATTLVLDAIDWHGKIEEKQERKPVRRKYTRRVPKEMFPPCIRNILSGLKDGRKRSIFTLITFLKHMNWTEEEIEKELLEWNERNEKPLSKRMITTQLRWHRGKDFLPANCFSDLFYVSIGVCQPDDRCRQIRNPVNYPRFSRNVCRICGKQFKTRRGLKLHLSKSHKG